MTLFVACPHLADDKAGLPDLGVRTKEVTVAARLMAVQLMAGTG